MGTRSAAALLVVLLLSLAACATEAKLVTIRNDVARRDVDGQYVDAHDGKIVHVNGTFYLYGEAYGNQTLATPYPWKQWPRLNVYTSPDLVHWTLQGDPLPMVTTTLWIPNVIYDEKTQRFVLWYGAGVWATATSRDGVNFTPSGPPFASRFGMAAQTDGTGIFVDDDGTGYVAFAVTAPPYDMPDHKGWPGHNASAHNFGHIVSIEKLTPDLLGSTKINVSLEFPDDLVESPSLFKRHGKYYLTYGSCCCGCAAGSGQVVFSAPAVSGPWVRQHPHADIDCSDATATICGGFARSTADVINHAQWWGPSFIPLKNGSTQVLFLGRQWLSGENHPPGCNDICGNGGKPALCQKNGDKCKRVPPPPRPQTQSGT
jgi:beta-xylosidase